MRRKIRRIFRRSKAFDILDSCGLESGFQDGGCMILSEAFAIWSNGAMSTQMVVSKKVRGGEEIDCFEHAISVLGSLYIDSDGVFSREDMVRKCISLENIAVDRIEDRFLEGDIESIPRNEGASKKLADLLLHELGEFSRDSFDRELRKEYLKLL